MPYETLESLARAGRWADVERDWLAAIERPDLEPEGLLPVLDRAVKAGQGDRAETMAWALLSTVKDARSPGDALRLGRELLLRLPDGGELRDEILTLYRTTHADRPDLDAWIERSGLESGKSVRRALRFLDTGLGLVAGAYLMHRTDDQAARITQLDFDNDEVIVQTARRTRTLSIAEVVGDYDVADENDFRILSQLAPDRINELLEKDRISLVIGILRGHGNQIDRDVLKLMLVPRYLPAEKWSDWWTQVRTGVKRSPHLRIEGRSPMMLIYDEVGRTPAQEAWQAFVGAGTPRRWLEILENHLRYIKQHKESLDTAFLDRVQKALVKHIERFSKHREPDDAFATALIIERVAADGLPVSSDVHGLALQMLRDAPDPVAIAAAVPDNRLWSLAVRCIEQAFPEKWPELFAELILHAPSGQCQELATRIEKAGRGDLFPPLVDQATGDPGRHTGTVMWIWSGPKVAVELLVPPLLEMLNLILGLVGPARMSEGKVAGQTVGEMRAKVRAGLAARDYGRFRECLDQLDDGMARTIRRLIDRAEGLGPSVQDDMGNILRHRFPKLYVRAKVALWDDDSVRYFTRAGLKAKEDEINELVNVKMRENARAIGEAAAHGDLSENSEYKFALEERDLLRARLAQLNTDVSRARVLTPADVPNDHVSIGHRVTLRPVLGGEPVVITILGVGDMDVANRVYSYQSPLARQVLGRRVAETASISIDGQEAEYEIEAVACVVT